jgi:hypothetical protein
MKDLQAQYIAALAVVARCVVQILPQQGPDHIVYISDLFSRKNLHMKDCAMGAKYESEIMHRTTWMIILRELEHRPKECMSNQIRCAPPTNSAEE